LNILVESADVAPGRRPARFYSDREPHGIARSERRLNRGVFGELVHDSRGSAAIGEGLEDAAVGAVAGESDEARAVNLQRVVRAVVDPLSPAVDLRRECDPSEVMGVRALEGGEGRVYSLAAFQIELCQRGRHRSEACSRPQSARDARELRSRCEENALGPGGTRTVVEGFLVLGPRKPLGARAERKDLSEDAVDVVVEVFVLPNLVLGESNDRRGGTVFGLDERDCDESARQDRENEGENRKPTQPSPARPRLLLSGRRRAGTVASEQHPRPNTHRTQVWSTSWC
jgi:hypothetical protein